jgi:yecA family protein
MDSRRRARRLSSKERKELESLMALRDPHFEGALAGSVPALHGFLTSVVSGPPVQPSQWIPVIFRNGESETWKTMKQAKRAMTLLARFYNEVVADLAAGNGRYGILLDRIGDPPHTVDVGDDWCKGYLAGVTLQQNAWRAPLAAPELKAAFAPILGLASREERANLNPFDHPEQYRAVLTSLPQCALHIYSWWRTPRRARRS